MHKNNQLLAKINRNRILDLLKSDRECSFSTDQVSNLIGLSVSATRRHLYELQNENQVVCTQNNCRKRGKLKLFKAL